MTTSSNLRSLVAVLRHPECSDDAKYTAGNILMDLCHSGGGQTCLEMSTNIGSLEDHVQLLKTIKLGSAARTAVTLGVWALTFDPVESIRIAGMGIIPVLVNMLYDDSSINRGCVAAASVISNMAADDENSEAIIDAGAIVALVRLLRCGADAESREAAAGALRNLLVRNDTKLAVFKEGGIPSLIALLHQGVEEQARTQAADALAMLAKRAPVAAAAAAAPIPAAAGGGVTGGVSQDETELEAEQQAASFIPHIRRCIAEEGAIPLLVDLLRSAREEDSRRAAAGALCNLAQGMGANVEHIVISGAIPPLLSLLRDAVEVQSRLAVVWGLIHMTRHNVAVAEVVAAAKGLDVVYYVLHTTAPPPHTTMMVGGRSAVGGGLSAAGAREKGQEEEEEARRVRAALLFLADIILPVAPAWNLLATTGGEVQWDAAPAA